MKRFADNHLHMTRQSDFETIPKYLNLIASVGVTDATLHSLPYHMVEQNLKVLYWKSHYDKIRLRAFGALHDFGPYAAIPPLKQAERLIELGADGIKMMEMDPPFRRDLKRGVNDPYYEDMFAMLEDRGIPVEMHVADPETFWEKREMSPEEIARGWFYGDGTYPSKEQLTEETLELCARHPKLKVTLAHFFFLSNFPEKAEEVMQNYPNVRFDLTPGWEMYLGFSKDIKFWHDFFTRYSNRILFGTDSNCFKDSNRELNQLVRMALSNSANEFAMPCFGGHIIRGLHLDQSVIDRITYNNYIDFVGENVRPVDDSVLRGCAERMLAHLKASGEAEIRRAEEEYPACFHGYKNYPLTLNFLETLTAKK